MPKQLRLDKTAPTEKALLGLAVASAAAGLWFCFTDRFYGGLVLVFGALWLWTWRKSLAGGRPKVSIEVAETVFLVALVLWLFTGAMGTSVTAGERPLIVDFVPTYAAGKLLLDSPSDLYSLDAQLKAERAATGLDLGQANFLPFAYFPFVAALFAPLTFVSFLTAYRLFTVVNLILLALSLQMVTSRLKLDRSQFRVLSLFTAAFFPVYIALVQGQTTFLLLILIAAFFTFLGKSGPWASGIAAGFLLFKPQFLVFPILLLLAKRYWRALAAAVLVIAGLAVVSVVLVGFEGVAANLDLLGKMGRGEEFTADPLNMYNLRAIAWFLGFRDWTWVVLSIVALGGVLWVFRGSGSGSWAPAAALVAVVLVAPHSNPHDGTLLLPALAMILSDSSRELRRSQLAFLLLLAFTPMLGFLIWNLAGVKWPLVPVILLGVLLACLKKAWDARPERRSREEAPI